MIRELICNIFLFRCGLFRHHPLFCRLFCGSVLLFFHFLLLLHFLPILEVERIQTICADQEVVIFVPIDIDESERVCGCFCITEDSWQELEGALSATQVEVVCAGESVRDEEVIFPVIIRIEREQCARHPDCFPGEAAIESCACKCEVTVAITQEEFIPITSAHDDVLDASTRRIQEGEGLGRGKRSSIALVQNRFCIEEHPFVIPVEAVPFPVSVPCDEVRVFISIDVEQRYHRSRKNLSEVFRDERQVGERVGAGRARHHGRNARSPHGEFHCDVREPCFVTVLHAVPVCIREDGAGETVECRFERGILTCCNNFRFSCRLFVFRSRDLLEDLCKHRGGEDDVRREDDAEYECVQAAANVQEIHRDPETIHNADVPLMRSIPPADRDERSQGESHTRCSIRLKHAVSVCVALSLLRVCVLCKKKKQSHDYSAFCPPSSML